MKRVDLGYEESKRKKKSRIYWNFSNCKIVISAFDMWVVDLEDFKKTNNVVQILSQQGIEDTNFKFLYDTCNKTKSRELGLKRIVSRVEKKEEKLDNADFHDEATTNSDYYEVFGLVTADNEIYADLNNGCLNNIWCSKLIRNRTRRWKSGQSHSGTSYSRSNTVLREAEWSIPLKKRTRMDEKSENNRTIQYKRFKAKTKVVHNNEESVETLHSMEILAEEHAKTGIRVSLLSMTPKRKRKREGNVLNLDETQLHYKKVKTHSKKVRLNKISNEQLQKREI
ncbi:hypothetical protein LIER_37402 [Lithospermum erythrorhizon]|uniref:Uncharacterized protein n=1 Tax=Lithospermum erythrorhizon TaxID=34254 RepID=A0AAV3PK46_LITER